MSIRESCSQVSVTGSAATGVPRPNSSVYHLADTGTILATNCVKKLNILRFDCYENGE